MTTIDEHGRREGPSAADEVATLRGFLTYQRDTLAWKCSGLDAAGLQATVAPSTMTLGGLLKHLAWVEDYWFSCRLHGEPPAAPWASVDWEADPDWEWNSASLDSPDELRALWADATTHADSQVDRALAAQGLDTLLRPGRPGSEPQNLRWVLCHMIEEYARHNGHADLLRESIDGQTGE